MRKHVLYLVAAMVTLLAGSNAMAENLQGRIGVTGKLGVIIPADSELSRGSDGFKRILETDAGFIGGGGLIYGVDNHVALELDVMHSEFHVRGNGTASVNDVSVGGQYRFAGKDRTVPYLGAGVDILMPDLSHADVDTVMGFHLKAGLDHFLSKELAVTAEVKAVEAFDADITIPGAKVGDFDPSYISATVGLRFFFN